MATSGAIILVTSTGKGTGRLDDEHRDSRVLRDSLDTISPRHPHTDVPPTQKTIRFTTHSTTGLSLLLLSFSFSFSSFSPFSSSFLLSRYNSFHDRILSTRVSPILTFYPSSPRLVSIRLRFFYRTNFATRVTHRKASSIPNGRVTISR